MARRVGFGGPDREQGHAREDASGAPAPAGDTPDAEVVGKEKKAGPVARLVIILILIVWLVLWSFGIYEAWRAAADLFQQPDWEVFDYAMLAFFAVWLTGALVGWAFGVVILVIMLFGKEVERSPSERAARLARRMARRRGGGEGAP